jgi:hypothetical protein
MAKVIRNTSSKFHSVNWIGRCSTDGKIDLAKIKATFSCSGSELENDGTKIVVKGNNLRVTTLFGDLKRAGFKVRWLPGFGWGKDSVGCSVPQEDMRFRIG